MYSERFQKSIAAVEAAREKNIALEPARMTAKQKEDLLAAFHPDYRQDQFDTLKIKEIKFLLNLLKFYKHTAVLLLKVLI